MPSKPIQRFYAWSFSRWRDYVKCALYAKFKYHDKLKEPEGPAITEGKKAHETAEAWALGKLKGPIPEVLKLFKEEFDVLKKLKPKTEQQLAFTRDWNPTGWFDKNVWVRVVIDAVAEDGKTKLRLIDHKTGKIYEDAMEQLTLYALAGFALYPEVEEISAELWYLSLGELREQLFVRSQEEELRKLWVGRTKKMLADTTYKPEPGDKCRWCAFSEKKGGPCPAA